MDDRLDLPTGTVTFLFSDIEGSTRLLQRLGDRFTVLLEQHNDLLRQAFVSRSGTVVRTEGDAFFVAFPSALQGLAAALAAQDALSAATWPDDAGVRVRIGLHTGVGTRGGDDYVGLDVHRAARITAAGHGGQVLVSEPTRALVEHDLPEGVRLRDLGEHRLKDLEQPERVYDVVRDGRPNDFPPLKTLGGAANDLPTQASAFLGREAELVAIRDLLTADGVRLVTLIGPGGIGKTRLALEVARGELQHFDDGVFFVELETVRDPEGVFDAIIRGAGLNPANDGRPVEALAQQLESRSVLLVLDNIEQVIDAADGVAELLRRCPRVRVLATSREALAVRDERTFAVPPLSVPQSGGALSAEAAARYEAVRLFVARAEQARPDFVLTNDNAADVADVCARLDGLPLAIELAAARVKLFSPHDLLQRLDSRLGLLRGGARDLPARQRTLRGAIEWSYELLDADECAMFALLSLFSTARLADVEAVAERLTAFAEVDILDVLTSLVDKSLVRSMEDAGSQRLAMLETIREYASERLAEDPAFSGAAKSAHAEHFCAFARAARQRLDGVERATALDELDAELGNLQTAWSYWLDSGDLQQLDELLETLWDLHDVRGRYKASVELAQELLAALSDAPSTPDLAEQKVVLAISAARGLMAIRGYTKEVDEAFRSALELLKEAGGLPKLFPVLRSLADLYLFRAEFDKAAVVGRQLLELAAQQRQDLGLQVDAHIVVGVNLASMGDMQAGREHLNRAIELFDGGARQPPRFRLGASPGVVARTSSAFQLWLLGYPDQAVARAEEALALSQRLAHPFTQAYALFHVGYLASWRENHDAMHDCASQALAVAEEHDYSIWQALALILQGVAMAGRGEGEAGLARAGHGISLYQGLSTPPVFWPLLLTLRAKGHVLAGRPDGGFAFIDEAIASFAGRHNFLYPDMPLVKGDLLLAASRPGEAEQCFAEAFDVGAAVEARMPQLRAATRLTRLARAAGGRPDGSDRLNAVYDTFTEGWSTAPLIAARELLDT